MPLDPKQIEEWKALADESLRAGEWGWQRAFLARYATALSALLSEREEMLALLRPARAGNVFGPDDLRALLGEVGFDADGMCRDCGKGFRGGLDHCKPDCRLAAFLR
jgi:hypothetical protein